LLSLAIATMLLAGTAWAIYVILARPPDREASPAPAAVPPPPPRTSSTTSSSTQATAFSSSVRETTPGVVQNGRIGSWVVPEDAEEVGEGHEGIEGRSMPAGPSLSAPEQQEPCSHERVKLGSASRDGGGDSGRGEGTVAQEGTQSTGGHESKADSEEKNAPGVYSMVWDRSKIDEQVEKHAQQEGETVRVVTTAELKRLLAERGVSQTEIRACLTRSDLDDLFWKIQAASSDSDHFIVM